MTESSAAASSEPGAVDYNVTGRRIIAAIIDIVLLSIVYAVFVAAFGDVETTNEAGERSFNVALTGAPFVLFAAVVFAYYALLEGLIGSTTGKLLLGLRVVTTEGGPCGLGKSALRNVLRIVDALPFLYMAGLVSVAVTRKNQRIGDLAAGTVVARM